MLHLALLRETKLYFRLTGLLIEYFERAYPNVNILLQPIKGKLSEIINNLLRI